MSKTTKVKAEFKLTPEEAEEIEAEEQSLPPVDSPLYVSQRSSADLQKTIKDMQLAMMPAADFQKTIKDMQHAMPSADLQKTIKSLSLQSKAYSPGKIPKDEDK